MHDDSQQELSNKFAGLLLGTAIGDALGLPAENLSPGRIARWWKGGWRMRFLFGRGMISDDTEHTLMVAQALLAHPEDAAAFQRTLGWKFRWWFAGLPGGVGLATAKACLRLWIGFPASKAGVCSAGGGPAMRSAVIGAYFAHDADKRRRFVIASSRLTHKTWQAEIAALAVAEAAALAVSSVPLACKEFLDRLQNLTPEPEWQETIAKLKSALSRRDKVSEFAKLLGLEKGVSGYAMHVAPVAIYTWLRHQHDFRQALIAAIECGGDTDTVGAIAGALCGAGCGADRLPQDWLDQMAEWPRTIGVMKRIAIHLAEQRQNNSSLGAVRYFWPGQIARNILFLIVVILHGFRRMLPPY